MFVSISISKIFAQMSVAGIHSRILFSVFAELECIAPTDFFSIVHDRQLFPKIAEAMQHHRQVNDEFEIAPVEKR